MFKKEIMVFSILGLISINSLFSQVSIIDTTLSNAANEIAESVPQGTRIAILNISSEYENLSDYIINELIANLVNKKLFQIVPRSTVELEAANMEFGFQMSGFVSDESAKSLGKFLGAGTIITGTVTRDSVNSYRLNINAIDLESFTYQSSYRESFQNNRQVQTLVGSSGGNYYEDYTTGERIGMGALNMFFGLGSIMNKQYLGFVNTGVEALGFYFLILGISSNPITPENGGKQSEYDDDMTRKSTNITVGSIIIGGSILFGYIIPFFHHKPNNKNVTQNNFPFGFELVSSNNQDINGFNIIYKMKY